MRPGPHAVRNHTTIGREQVMDINPGLLGCGRETP
jgi:hypothetical protein